MHIDTYVVFGLDRRQAAVAVITPAGLERRYSQPDDLSAYGAHQALVEAVRRA